MVKNLPENAGHLRQGFNLWVAKIPWRRKWRIPWTEGPSGLQSMGFQSQTRVSD